MSTAKNRDSWRMRGGMPKKEEKNAERRNALDLIALIDLYLRRKREPDDREPDLDHFGARVPRGGKSKRQ